jgi:hypothetical protein
MDAAGRHTNTTNRLRILARLDINDERFFSLNLFSMHSLINGPAT